MPGPIFDGGFIYESRIDPLRDRPRASSCAVGHDRDQPHHKDRQAIVITELPYQVGPLLSKRSSLWSATSESRGSRTSGTSPTGTNTHGLELKRDENPGVILNNLYKFTKLQSTFGVIFSASSTAAAGVPSRICSGLRRLPPEVVRRTQYSLGRPKSAPTSWKD